jgi:hypothetical protein
MAKVSAELLRSGGAALVLIGLVSCLGGTVVINNSTSTSPPNIAFGAPSFTLNRNIFGTTGVPTNSGAAITSCAIAPTLPLGLSINPATCEISGTAVVGSASTTYTVTAVAGSASQPVQVELGVTVLPPALTFVNSPFSSTLNQTFAITAPANTGSSVQSCVLDPGNVSPLPSGLTIGSNCSISGTPTSVIAETLFTLDATNDGGTSQVQFQLAVVAGPPLLNWGSSTVTIPVGAYLEGYLYGSALAPQGAGRLTPLSNSGGGPTQCCDVLAGDPLEQCLTSTSTPPSITANGNLSFYPDSNCALGGQPATTMAASPITVKASNAYGSTLSTLHLAIATIAPDFPDLQPGGFFATHLYPVTVAIGSSFSNNWLPNIATPSTSCAENASDSPSLASFISGLTIDPSCSLGGTVSMSAPLGTPYTFNFQASNSAGAGNAPFEVLFALVAPNLGFQPAAPMFPNVYSGYTWTVSGSTNSLAPVPQGSGSPPTSCVESDGHSLAGDGTASLSDIGLSIDPTTCTISGIANKTNSGVCYTLTASNATGQSGAAAGGSQTIQVSVCASSDGTGNDCTNSCGGGGSSPGGGAPPPPPAP